MEDARQKAFELAVGAIARKERTVAELREWLAARAVEADEIEATLDRLISIGELDDEHFATLYAQDKRELSGWGPDRILSALLDRGVDRALAEAAVGGEDQSEQAERAASLVLDRGHDLEQEAGRGKALAFLARRGYPSEVAYQAVRLAERRAA